jgi:wobble nucleotide-excising tRNase
MATIDELIASIEVEKEAIQKKRDKARTEAKAILALAQSEGRSNTSEEEDTRLAELYAATDKAKADLRGVDRKLADAHRIKAEEAEAVREAQETRPTPAATRAPKK